MHHMAIKWWWQQQSANWPPTKLPPYILSSLTLIPLPIIQVQMWTSQNLLSGQSTLPNCSLTGLPIFEKHSHRTSRLPKKYLKTRCSSLKNYSLNCLTPMHNSEHNQPEPSSQPLLCSPPTHQLPTKQPANTVAAILSPLNTRFLLPTGDYDAAANGVLWYTASLFSFLPFMQTIPRPTTTDTWSDCTACRIQSVWQTNNCTIPDLTDGCTTLSSSKTFAYDYTMMAWPNVRAHHTTTLQPTG